MTAGRLPGCTMLPAGIVFGVLALLLGSLLGLSACNSNGGSEPPPDDGTGNHAPTISGTPPTSIKVGENYSFQPVASDADGDALTFSIEAMPGWASFDSTTGALSGTPQPGDEGSYDNISITVSDGSASDAVGFDITVSQFASGSVTLSWTPPTLNTDGSTLTDLAGYEIYYGVTSGSYTEQIHVDNPGLTTFVVDNLSPDTYYFVATSVNSSGVESSFSGESVHTVVD